MILGVDWAGLGFEAYPFSAAPLSAPSALTAGPFCLGKRNHGPLAPAYGPTLRFGSPRYGTFQGHAAYDLLRQVYVSRLRLTPKVLRTAPTGASTRPAEVALCGA